MQRFSPIRRVTTLLSGDWSLTQEQALIRGAALKFAHEEMAPYANEWDERMIFPRACLEKAAELGFGSLYCAEEYGGSGLSLEDSVLVFEALATGCITTAAYLTVHNMCGGILDVYGTHQQKERWLRDLCTMKKLSSYCLTEPRSGSEVLALESNVTKQGDFYILNGSKMFVSGGECSDIFLVICKLPENQSTCLLVENGTPGLGFGKDEKKIGWNSIPTQMLTFENCKVPEDNLIGKPGEGFEIAMRATGNGRVTLGSCAVGGAWFALDKAQKYMNDRSQFKTKLHEFQYLRFQMAEALTKLVISRVVVKEAARLVDLKSDVCATFGAMAKYYITDVCFDVANKALQMHGGYGVIKSTGIERALRDLRIMQIAEGTNEIMRHLIAKELFKEYES